jgi:cytidylate kinase
MAEKAGTANNTGTVHDLLQPICEIYSDLHSVHSCPSDHSYDMLARMIVTIDGPAGAGKSSAARELASRLGFRFLDTGAMYRAVTWAALRQGLNLNDQNAIAKLAQSIDLQLQEQHVLVDGQDVTEAIRSTEVTTHTRYAADNPAVRTRLVTLQREFAAKRDCVTEGRDQASVVFPNANCKIFLTASPEERAQRRHLDLLSRGERIKYEEVLEKQLNRDRQDQQRKIGALAKTNDSIEVCTDGLSPSEVVDRLETLVKTCSR